MTNTTTAGAQVRAMLVQGWRWRDEHSDVLVHPHDYNLTATYDRAADTLALSAALVGALDLIVLTPSGKNLRYWRDEKKNGRREPRKK